MKRIILLSLASVGIVFGVGGAPDRDKNPKAPAIREFMRQKLTHSQAVLEGIALEDFNLILVNARKLVAMSHEGSWRVLEGSGYNEHSVTFRRNAEALVKASNLASLDGATLAYVKMTMSCVECHKYVRTKQAAMRERVPALEGLIPPPTAVASATRTPARDAGR
jgi:hypothetical protein